MCKLPEPPPTTPLPHSPRCNIQHQWERTQIKSRNNICFLIAIKFLTFELYTYRENGGANAIPVSDPLTIMHAEDNFQLILKWATTCKKWSLFVCIKERRANPINYSLLLMAFRTLYWPVPCSLQKSTRMYDVCINRWEPTPWQATFHDRLRLISAHGFRMGRHSLI